MIKRFVNNWKGCDFKAVRWWLWPIAIPFVFISAVACAIGFHEKDCIWCDDHQNL